MAKKQKSDSSKLGEALAKQLGQRIGSVEAIVRQAAALQLEQQNLTITELRQQFSSLVQLTEQKCYEVYLDRQNSAGEEIVRAFIAEHPGKPVFEILDKFFLSIAQSRKSRAGKTFETTIRELFRRCGYPFQEQCIVNGKPDFLMPGEAHYRKHPTDCIIFTAKRTLRERWRQIATEGTRGKALFLATLDDTITESAIVEMLSNRIYLVVPGAMKAGEPAYINAVNVLSFEEFFLDHLDPAMERWKRSGAI